MDAYRIDQTIGDQLTVPSINGWPQGRKRSDKSRMFACVLVCEPDSFGHDFPPNLADGNPCEAIHVQYYMQHKLT